MEIKSYSIAGKNFELRPLTWKQRQLTSSIEKEIRKRIITLAQIIKPDLDTTDISKLPQVYEISVEVSDLLYSEDKKFLEFLTTILVPAGTEKWSENLINDNLSLMEEITDDVLSEVMSDFFIRSTGVIPGTKIIQPV